MFICQVSGRLSASGEKPVRIVTEKRERVYFVRTRDGNQKEIGRGWEIVTELLVCREVAMALQAAGAI